MPTVLGVEGWQCSSQRSAMKSPVHCGNPKDERQTIDTCIPVVHALFFSLIDILSGGISSFSIIIASFLSLYTARPSFEYYQQVYFVHSGLQDESLQVTISKLP